MRAHKSLNGYNLCDSCKCSFAECKQDLLTFNDPTDEVIVCSSFESSEIKPGNVNVVFAPELGIFKRYNNNHYTKV